jgi:hypothetical protein
VPVAAPPVRGSVAKGSRAVQHWDTVRSAVAASAFQEDSGGDGEETDDEQQPQQYAEQQQPAKRRRGAAKPAAAAAAPPSMAAAADEAYLSDAEQRRLAKRREKNRRTARVSRERRNAEVQQMRDQLEVKTAEVARLQAIVAEKDRQLDQLSRLISSDKGAAAADDGAQERARGANVSGSAELDVLIGVASCLLSQGPPLRTASSMDPTLEPDGECCEATEP